MPESSALRNDLIHAGYYPELVADVLDTALAGEDVRAHYVHPETTFDTTEVRRHVTVLLLTDTRLIMAHVDDRPAQESNQTGYAAATTEAVPLSAITMVSLSHVVADPAHHVQGSTPLELTLGIGWGGVSRIELEPAGCSDPSCEADHGYSGALLPDDVLLRISAEAEGYDSVKAAQDFAARLSAATIAR